ncbi:MAG: hypothetical protein ACREJC_19695, partial [Tepidisphaeraceae bacterium]
SAWSGMSGESLDIVTPVAVMLSHHNYRRIGDIAVRAAVWNWAILGNMRIRLPVFLLLVALCGAGPATQPEDRAARLRQNVEKTVELFEALQKRPDFKAEARQYSQYAHYVLALGQDPHKAEEALRRLSLLQNLNSGSPRYGEIAPVEGRAATDTGATELTVLPLPVIYLRYGDKLSAGTLEQLRKMMSAALVALRREKIPVDRTGLFLANLVDRLLIAEILDDSTAVDEAVVMLDNFLEVMRGRGLSEFVSPHYTAVQLSALLIGQNNTKSPRTRGALEVAARFLWAQIAASALPLRGTLSGPHARDMDFITNVGGIDDYMYLEGVRHNPPLATPFSEGLRAWTNYVEKAFRPDKETLDWASAIPREVISRWGLEQGKDRYFYVTSGYAMGSSSCFASGADRKVCFEFVTNKALPVIWVVADMFDHPYGNYKLPNGMLITQHLHDQIAAVQNKNTLLALMNLRREVADVKHSSVATNVIIPARADAVLLNGKKVPLDKPIEVPVPPDSVVIVFEHGSAVAIKLFDVDGLAGQKPGVFLKYDGNKFGQARLVAYHYKGDRHKMPDEACRVGVIMLASEITTPAAIESLATRAASAKIESQTNGNLWRVRLVDDQTTLEAGLNTLGSGAHLNVARRINGQDYDPAVFTVNGRDVAADLLDPILAARKKDEVKTQSYR